MLDLVPYGRFHVFPLGIICFDGSTLRELSPDVDLVLYHPRLPIHRPQRCAGSAFAAGSRLVSSRLCPPGSGESASDKAPRGVSCLVSSVVPITPTQISSSHAIASHRDSAPESTPGCSRTTDAEPPPYASSYPAPDDTLSVGPPLLDQL